MRRIRSLTARLVVSALVWLAVALGVGGTVLAFAFRDTVERSFDRRLDALVQALVAAVEVRPDGTLTLSRPLGDPRFEQVFSGWYWQVSGDGGPALRSRSLWDQVLPPDGARHGGAPQRREMMGPRRQPLVVIERDLTFPDREGTIHVLIAADRTEVDDEVRHFDLLLLLALGSLGGVLLAAVISQVRFGLRPLRALAGELAALRKAPGRRLGLEYPVEVAPLVRAMNAVLDHDADLIERARTHVGNLAHALKTPLSVLKVESRNPHPDGVVITEQVTAMTRLVEYHLNRARSSASSAVALGLRVPVAEVVEGLRPVLAKVYGERNLSWRIDVAEDAEFVGERGDLEEIVGNLLDNACKWAATTVAVSARGTGGALIIAVEDDGPGLDPEQAALAANRGVRLDERAPGWGLGLAVVSDLVALLGASLRLDRSPLGGLRATVAFQGRANKLE
ncbi:MAG: ATP-binding protein [Magnetospirillum sp.]|nr:ATP-binding protein [Magnetospirillum sp.]